MPQVAANSHFLAEGFIDSLGSFAAEGRRQCTAAGLAMTLRSDPVILVAEHSDDDVALLRRAFQHLAFSSPIHFLSDGRDVASYLQGIAGFSDRRRYPLPDIVLLDLKITGMNGFDILKWWRKQRRLAALRFVVLTAADAIQDTNEAFRLGAASFLVKPVDFNELRNTLFELIRYWRANQASPSHGRSPGKRAAEGSARRVPARAKASRKLTKR